MNASGHGQQSQSRTFDALLPTSRRNLERYKNVATDGQNIG